MGFYSEEGFDGKFSKYFVVLRIVVVYKSYYFMVKFEVWWFEFYVLW